MSLTAAVACLLASSTGAGAAPVRVALYGGPGAILGDKDYPYQATLEEAAALLGPSSVTVVDEDAVRQNLTAFDVVFFPGGYGSKEASGLGSEGQEAVKAFVAAGGGYIGTCAGAFLGMTSLLFYGAGPHGSGPPVQSLGEGLVEVGFSELGMQQLHLDPKVFSGNVSIFYMYEGGPVVNAGDLPSNVSVLAWYRSPVPSWLPKPQGVGTPAVTSALYGHGRVILNSPHAEHTQSGGIGTEFYAGELAWVLGRSDKLQLLQLYV